MVVYTALNKLDAIQFYEQLTLYNERIINVITRYTTSQQATSDNLIT